MLNLMDAEVFFTNPADVNPAIAELLKRDFSVKTREDMIDEGGPTVFILATVGERPQPRWRSASDLRVYL
jgi:hypothetical protein